MITPLIARFRNSEFIRFHKDVVSLCTAATASGLKIATQVNELDASLQPMNEAFKKERASLHSQKLAGLDERRDTALTGIRLLADACTHHFDAVKQQAGMVVLAAIDKFGTRIANLNYVAETEVVEALVKEFETNNQVKAAIAQLSITDWVAELKQANEAFNTLYLTRTSEYAQQPQVNMNDLKTVVTEKYRQLSRFINSYATLEPSEACTQLIGQLNSLITQYNNTVSGRGGSSADDETTPPPQS